MVVMDDAHEIANATNEPKINAAKIPSNKPEEKK
jgi:hypothetical protein